jgi:DNA-binding response OmpR family regulator
MTIIETILEEIRNSKLSNSAKDDVIKIINKTVREGKKEPITSCGVELHPNSYKIIQGDNVSYLPNKAFRMLYYFMQNPNVYLTREDIINNCWEQGVIVGQRTIDVHLHRIKKILKNKSNLKTKKRIGYGWVI